ncbi:unnamed protein product [Closterium sp. NIES-64]|nr:unnamed protein product [Closterium sp. NIES-64]
MTSRHRDMRQHLTSPLCLLSFATWHPRVVRVFRLSQSLPSLHSSTLPLFFSPSPLPPSPLLSFYFPLPPVSPTPLVFSPSSLLPLLLPFSPSLASPRQNDSLQPVGVLYVERADIASTGSGSVGNGSAGNSSAGGEEYGVSLAALSLLRTALFDALLSRRPLSHVDVQRVAQEAVASANKRQVSCVAISPNPCSDPVTLSASFLALSPTLSPLQGSALLLMSVVDAQGSALLLISVVEAQVLVPSYRSREYNFTLLSADEGTGMAAHYATHALDNSSGATPDTSQGREREREGLGECDGVCSGGGDAAECNSGGDGRGGSKGVCREECEQQQRWVCVNEGWVLILM